MKVGIVCPYDWSHPGGVRTHIIGLSKALQRKGISTEIIAPASRAEEGIFTAGRTIGIPANGSVARICFSRAARRRVAARISGADLDLLHLHEPAIPSVSLLALMNPETLPSVATFHAFARRSLGYAAARPVLRRYLEQLRHRIAVSGPALEFISRYFPGRYRVIPNGVDTSSYAGAEPDDELIDAKPFVLFVGRPEPRKGFGVLVDAMGEVRKSSDVRLATVGAVPKSRQSWILPLGAVDDSRLPGIYAAADLFCAPSLGGESFGLVLVEAMAAGTPVVVSDIPGYREAAGGAAELVAPGDARSLAGAISRLLSDSSGAADLVARGKARAASLDWDAVSTEVLGVYREALRGAGD